MWVLGSNPAQTSTGCEMLGVISPLYTSVFLTMRWGKLARDEC
jgi:hypothetical protein